MLKGKLLSPLYIQIEYIKTVSNVLSHMSELVVIQKKLTSEHK
jgi:hypothetical protein